MLNGLPNLSGKMRLSKGRVPVEHSEWARVAIVILVSLVPMIHRLATTVRTTRLGVPSTGTCRQSR